MAGRGGATGALPPLGGLLDATSQGLRALPDVRLDRLPRMADLAIWGPLRTRAMARRVCPAYKGNRRTAIEDAIEANPVAACVRALMAERGAWAGAPPTCWAATVAVTEVRPTAPVGPRTCGASRPLASRADLPAIPGHRGRLQP